MKVVRFYGGLGNQMFQYAMLTALKEKWGEEVLMDTHLYASYGLHNGFELTDVFAVSAKAATKEQIAKLSLYTECYKFSRFYHHCLPSRKTEFKERTYGKFYPEALERKGDMLYDGYWQHWEYFDSCRDCLLKEFALTNELDERNRSFFEWLKASPKSVSVHVRRGDFLKSRLYRGLCGKDYYEKAISEAKNIIGEDAGFHFFTDDIGWCKDNFEGLIAKDGFHLVDWNVGKDSFKDMMLMSACRVNITANSSFSWWGAYLNQRTDKVVIAPAKWINKKMANPIQMPEWILL